MVKKTTRDRRGVGPESTIDYLGVAGHMHLNGAVQVIGGRSAISDVPIRMPGLSSAGHREHPRRRGPRRRGRR